MFEKQNQHFWDSSQHEQNNDCLNNIQEDLLILPLPCVSQTLAYFSCNNGWYPKLELLKVV